MYSFLIEYYMIFFLVHYMIHFLIEEKISIFINCILKKKYVSILKRNDSI